MWYGSNSYSEIDSPNPSYIISAANMLKHYGDSLDPVVLARMVGSDHPIDWHSIMDVIDSLEVDEISNDSSWPNSAAIVKFQHIDEYGQLQQYYSFANDPTTHNVIDSKTGESLNPSATYGNPIGWSTYKHDPETFNIQKVEQKDHWPKELSVPKHLTKDNIYYEVYNEPKEMHVANENGTRKVAFGVAKSATATIPTGPNYAYQRNVMIVAMAHVPMQDDTIGYYMDAKDLGHYRSTGHVAYNIGYIPSELADGHIYEPVPKPAEPAIPIEQQAVIAEALEAAKQPEIAPEPPVLTHSYKSSYQALPEPVTYYVQLDSGETSITVLEHDSRRPSRPVADGQPIVIAGMFHKDGIIYGRPDGSVRAGYWFGIPMDSLITEDELFDTKLSISDKLALHHKLSPDERAVAILGGMLSKYGLIQSWYNKRRSKK